MVDLFIELIRFDNEISLSNLRIYRIFSNFSIIFDYYQNFDQFQPFSTISRPFSTIFDHFSTIFDHISIIINNGDSLLSKMDRIPNFLIENGSNTKFIIKKYSIRFDNYRNIPSNSEYKYFRFDNARAYFTQPIFAQSGSIR